MNLLAGKLASMFEEFVDEFNVEYSENHQVTSVKVAWQPHETYDFYA